MNNPTLLALDGALARCSAVILVNGALASAHQQTATRGQAALLPEMAERALNDAGLIATDLDGVAVTVGPGSFTGLRAAIALAHGIAVGAGCPVVGVTLHETFADELAAMLRLSGRTLWSAIDSHRGRVVLQVDGATHTVMLSDMPQPTGPVALAGDAAQAVSCRLAARNADVMLTRVRLPSPLHIALVGARRVAGELAPLAAQPQYFDAPAVRLPIEAARPPPA